MNSEQSSSGHSKDVTAPEAVDAAPSIRSEGDTAPMQTVVSDFVRDAMGAFTEDEEAFFAQGSKLESEHTAPIETFDDLENDSRRATFWQRLVNPTGVARRERNRFKRGDGEN